MQEDGRHFRVGVITSIHGVKGGVKVFPTTDDMTRFERLEEVKFSPGDREEDIKGSLHIASVQYSKGQVILSFREVHTVETAQRLKGGSLWIPDEQAVPLEENEFYLRDFLEATVVEETGESLGTVSDILETGAGHVLEITRKDGRSLLLPVIRDCVLEMDAASRTIKVHLLEGLE